MDAAARQGDAGLGRQGTGEYGGNAYIVVPGGKNGEEGAVLYEGELPDDVPELKGRRATFINLTLHVSPSSPRRHAALGDASTLFWRVEQHHLTQRMQTASNLRLLCRQRLLTDLYILPCRASSSPTSSPWLIHRADIPDRSPLPRRASSLPPQRKAMLRRSSSSSAKGLSHSLLRGLH